MKKFLLMLAFIQGSLVLASGQMATVQIAGLAVHCSDSTGAVVYTVVTPGVGDSARSSIAPNGMRLISLDANAFPRIAPLLQLFIYAHECGHHQSGDIVAGIYFHHDNPRREMNADRIGIRLVRDQLQISEAQARQIAAAFANNPPIPPYYLPGPQRAQWILDCFHSGDDNECGHSTARYDRPSADPGPAPVRRNASQSNRCSDEYNECVSEVPSFDECMEKRTQGCMNDCLSNYRYGYALCANRFCNPEMGSNVSWAGRCRQRIRDKKQDCSDKRNDCTKGPE